MVCAGVDPLDTAGLDPLPVDTAGQLACHGIPVIALSTTAALSTRQQGTWVCECPKKRHCISHSLGARHALECGLRSLGSLQTSNATGEGIGKPRLTWRLPLHWPALVWYRRGCSARLERLVLAAWWWAPPAALQHRRKKLGASELGPCSPLHQHARSETMAPTCKRRVAEKGQVQQIQRQGRHVSAQQAAAAVEPSGGTTLAGGGAGCPAALPAASDIAIATLQSEQPRHNQPLGEETLCACATAPRASGRGRGEFRSQ